MANDCGDQLPIRIQTGTDNDGNPIYDSGQIINGFLVFNSPEVYLTLGCGLTSPTPDASGNQGDPICLEVTEFPKTVSQDLFDANTGEAVTVLTSVSQGAVPLSVTYVSDGQIWAGNPFNLVACL